MVANTEVKNEEQSAEALYNALLAQITQLAHKGKKQFALSNLKKYNTNVAQIKLTNVFQIQWKLAKLYWYPTSIVFILIKDNKILKLVPQKEKTGNTTGFKSVIDLDFVKININGTR